MVVTLEGAFRGEENMARDLALLEAGVPGARVYGWEGPWVSLGRFQRPERALVAGCKVPWVVRPTGGKGVLHGHDVTVGMAFPLEHFRVSGSRSVGAVYRALVPILLRALAACGVPAALGESLGAGGQGPTADCFAHVAPLDVVDPASGRKVCGVALRLTGSAVLLQASIPAGPPLVAPSAVFAGAAEAGWVQLEAAALARALARAG